MKAPRNLLAVWRSARARASQVLSINKRNLDYIYPLNPRERFPLADNKLLTKELLREAGVPVPETYRVYSYYHELRGLAHDLGEYKTFVIKPARGSGGGGIVVIKGRQGEGWSAPGGRYVEAADLSKHISDIIFGVYSFDLSDQAIIEASIVQHAALADISPFGLADLRLLMCRRQLVLAMLRVPTRRSHGRANLHQGALGVGVDHSCGVTTNGLFSSQPIERHPDTGMQVRGFSLPMWDTVLDIGRRTAAAVPLEYLGIDVVFSPDGPLVLEVNARPGLEIQNANREGLRALLEATQGTVRP